jgi:hypothetical protein
MQKYICKNWVIKLDLNTLCSDVVYKFMICEQEDGD